MRLSPLTQTRGLLSWQNYRPSILAAGYSVVQECLLCYPRNVGLVLRAQLVDIRDNGSLDMSYACLVNALCPMLEQQRVAKVPRLQGGVALSFDIEVAIQGAILYVSGIGDGCLESVFASP